MSGAVSRLSLRLGLFAVGALAAYAPRFDGPIPPARKATPLSRTTFPGCGTAQREALRVLAYRSPVLEAALLGEVGRLVTATAALEFDDVRDNGCVHRDDGPCPGPAQRPQDGLRRVYDTRGRLRLEGRYFDGRRDGRWVRYSADGRRLEERDYWEGRYERARRRAEYLERVCWRGVRPPDLEAECVALKRPPPRRFEPALAQPDRDDSD